MLYSLDYSREKTIAIILRDIWWPQTAKQKGGRTNKQFFMSYSIWKKRSECPNIGGVSIRSRNGAPSSRKGCVANERSNS